MKTIEIHPLKGRVNVSVDIPGSKSYTNRALLIAALTFHKVKITNALISEDTLAMIHCLKTLGIKINTKKNIIEVAGDIRSIKNKKFDLGVNLSGTTLRFLLPTLVTVPGTKILYGKEDLNRRPVNDLVDALVSSGADIS